MELPIVPPEPKRFSISSLRKDELISLIEGIFVCMDRHERALHELMTRWENGVPPEVRGEIMTIYQPLLHKMIELGLRPFPR
jgi:hypothetical protein